MNKKEKIKFIDEMLRNLKISLMSRIDNVPEEWDGIELREWVIDFANNNYVLRCLFPKKSKRYRDYKRKRIARNL